VIATLTITRPDRHIREDVNDALTDDPYLDANGVAVQVEDGEVTLDGTVGTRAARRRAEIVVEDVAGVRRVRNNLRIAGATHQTERALH
jgi:osmotically-inducible protein OsmY